MHMLKLFFRTCIQIRPILAPERNSLPPGALLKITTWRQVEASRPLCFRERHHPPLGIANCPRREYYKLFFNLILPEFQNPSLHLVYFWYKHLVYFWYKNVGLEREDKMVC